MQLGPEATSISEAHSQAPYAATSPGYGKDDIQEGEEGEEQEEGSTGEGAISENGQPHAHAVLLRVQKSNWGKGGNLSMHPDNASSCVGVGHRQSLDAHGDSITHASTASWDYVFKKLSQQLLNVTQSVDAVGSNSGKGVKQPCKGGTRPLIMRKLLMSSFHEKHSRSSSLQHSSERLVSAFAAGLGTLSDEGAHPMNDAFIGVCWMKMISSSLLQLGLSEAATISNVNDYLRQLTILSMASSEASTALPPGAPTRNASAIYRFASRKGSHASAEREPQLCGSSSSSSSYLCVRVAALSSPARSPGSSGASSQHSITSIVGTGTSIGNGRSSVDASFHAPKPGQSGGCEQQEGRGMEVGAARNSAGSVVAEDYSQGQSALPIRVSGGRRICWELIFAWRGAGPCAVQQRDPAGSNACSGTGGDGSIQEASDSRTHGYGREVRQQGISHVV